MKIQDRVRKLVEEDTLLGFATSVKTTNAALRSIGGQDRLDLAIEIFRLWLNRRCKNGDAETKEVLGTVAELGCRLMLTLTSDERQFRVWYGVPADVGKLHVDSCGENLLFWVCGNPGMVRRYADEFSKECCLDRHKVKFPNGTWVYMRCSGY